jgi:hypothetical protein
MRIPSNRPPSAPLAFDRAIHTAISRRQFMRRSAVAVGGLTGFELLRGAPPAFAKGSSAPRPIPGGFALPNFDFVPSGADLHVFPARAGPRDVQHHGLQRPHRGGRDLGERDGQRRQQLHIRHGHALHGRRVRGE